MKLFLSCRCVNFLYFLVLYNSLIAKRHYSVLVNAVTTVKCSSVVSRSSPELSAPEGKQHLFPAGKAPPLCLLSLKKPLHDCEMPLPCAAPSVPQSHSKGKGPCFVKPSLALGNLVLVVETSYLFQMFLLWQLSLLTMGISILGGEVLYGHALRGVGTRGIARLRRLGKI